jgi:hypothetical protein
MSAIDLTKIPKKMIDGVGYYSPAELPSALNAQVKQSIIAAIRRFESQRVDMLKPIEVNGFEIGYRRDHSDPVVHTYALYLRPAGTIKEEVKRYALRLLVDTSTRPYKVSFEEKMAIYEDPFNFGNHKPEPETLRRMSPKF